MKGKPPMTTFFITGKGTNIRQNSVIDLEKKTAPE